MKVICGVTPNPSISAIENCDYGEVIGNITSILDRSVGDEMKATVFNV